MREKTPTPEESFAWAQEQIAEVKAANAGRLDLDYPEGRALQRLPVEIGDLTQLETLDLDNTQVSDLGALSGLSGLQVLSLDNTQVSDLGALSRLSGLQTLTLDNTQVADLRGLEGLSGLQELRLDNTPVTDLRALAGLSGLQRLTLNNTQVSDLGALSGLSGLQTLYLNDTQVSDLTALQGQSGLQTLFLDDTQVSDLLPLAGLSKLGEEVFGGLWFSDTPAADRDDAHRSLAAIEDDQDRAKQVLQYLNGEHPKFGGPPEPWVPPAPPKPKTATDEEPEQVQAALDGPFLTLSHTNFAVKHQKVSVLPFDHDAMADPTESRSHKDMLETLVWAAGELLRLAELNQLGRRDADRLSQYVGYAEAELLNARLLQMIARSLRASIETAKEEGRLQPDDLQIAEDFLLAHSSLIREFYPQVLSVEARVAAQEIDESVTAGDILSPIQQLGGVLREEADLVTPELRAAFDALERVSEDYRDAEDRAALISPEDAEASRSGFLYHAKRAGATIGRLYLFVKKHWLMALSAAGSVASLASIPAQTLGGFVSRLAEVWQKIAHFFPPLF